MQNKISQLIPDVFGRECIITSSVAENDSDTKQCRVKLIHSPKKKKKTTCHDIIGKACVDSTQSQIIFHYKKRNPVTKYSQFTYTYCSFRFREEKEKENTNAQNQGILLFLFSSRLRFWLLGFYVISISLCLNHNWFLAGS